MLTLVAFLIATCLLWATAARAAPLLPGIDVSGYEADVHAFLSAKDDAPPRLEVQFHGGVEWPHVILRPTTGAWHWSLVQTLVLPVDNPGAIAVEVFIRIGDDDAASWPDHALAASATVPAHGRVELAIPLTPHDSRAMGMREGPPPLEARGQAVIAVANPTGRLAEGQQKSLFVVVSGRAGARSLILGTPHAQDWQWETAAYQGLIDRFGQVAFGNWPGKVGQTRDLFTGRNQQAARLLLLGAQLPAHDLYQGRSDGPTFTPTGFFYCARDAAGQWWLVTPQGHAFFSIGANAVSIEGGKTYIEGREFMFKDLVTAPPGDARIAGSADHRADMLAQQSLGFDHGRWYNFYAANVAEKYGPNYPEQWAHVANQRLLAWGFNTIGDWSDDSLFPAHVLPYTVPVSIHGDFATVPSGFDYWGAMPDPFDARFARAADQALAHAAQTRYDDPWLIGYFVDNELAWGRDSDDPRQRYGLALGALALGGSSPAKSALVKRLRDRYSSIDELARTWGIVAPASWQALIDNPLHLEGPISESARADLAGFARVFAEQYFRVVVTALKRHDAHHLYLGSRFAAQTPEAVAACERYCDVVSFNVYADNFAAARQARFGALAKPAIIGEFNFSSTDRGPFWRGLIDVGSEAARGPAYAAYLAAAARDPAIVGVHWFQYVDEPASGRILDGENAHFGLVSITDTPYDDFVTAVQHANLDALSVRIGHAQQAPHPETREAGQPTR